LSGKSPEKRTLRLRNTLLKDEAGDLQPLTQPLLPYLPKSCSAISLLRL